MFISKKKYRQELNQAWVDGHNVGKYEGERKGRRERITTTDIQNYLGRFLVSNRSHNDNLLTRHSCWITRSEVYDLVEPNKTYVWKECAECGHKINYALFDTEDWNIYHKERWNPKNLPTFCDHCGSMMDEEDKLEKTRVRRHTIREKLKPHIGHNVVCICYGNVDNPVDVCIECEDCNEVLISAETEDAEEYTT